MKRYSTLKTYKPLKSYSRLKAKSSFKHKKYSRIKGDLDLAHTDGQFSKWIISRDQKCLRCGINYMLTCSHFYGRSTWNTRYDEENCITLCSPCHAEWESKKNGEYKDFKFDKRPMLGLSSDLKIDN
jgi:5-methylcytosine-specific restriction endonuclease McrA